MQLTRRWIAVLALSWRDDFILGERHVDNSAPHAVPYCVVTKVMSDALEGLKQQNKRIQGHLDWSALHMYWAMCYDAKHPKNWFSWTNDAEELRIKWEDLCGKGYAPDFVQDQESFHRAQYPDGQPAPIYFPNLMRTERTDRPQAVLQSGKALCDYFEQRYSGNFHRHLEVYKAAMKDKPLKQKAVDVMGNEPPLMVVVSGGPCSGKSVSSFSDYDFKLVRENTCEEIPGTRGCPDRAFRSFPTAKAFKDSIPAFASVNLDGIVHASDVMHLLSDFFAKLDEHPATNPESAEVLEAKRAFLEKYNQWAVAAKTDTEAATWKAKVDSLLQGGRGRGQDTQQTLRETTYQMLKRVGGIDDLSNAHNQRVIAERETAWYETFLLTRSIDWMRGFEIPKWQVASYSDVILNLAVPVQTLIDRCTARQVRTGQKMTPRDEVEQAVRESPAEFMNLKDVFRWGIMYGHVRYGKSMEHPLVVYKASKQNAPNAGHNIVMCAGFTRLANYSLPDSIQEKCLEWMKVAYAGGCDTSQRVVVFGGSFDPPTVAHRAIIEYSAQMAGTAMVIVVPSGGNMKGYVKYGKSPYEDRLNWTKAMVDGLNDVPPGKVRVSDIEKNGPLATPLLLDLVQEREGINFLRLAFVVGSDYTDNLHNWAKDMPDGRRETVRWMKRCFLFHLRSSGDVEAEVEGKMQSHGWPLDHLSFFSAPQARDLSSSELRKNIFKWFTFSTKMKGFITSSFGKQPLDSLTDLNLGQWKNNLQQMQDILAAGQSVQSTLMSQMPKEVCNKLSSKSIQALADRYENENPNDAKAIKNEILHGLVPGPTPNQVGSDWRRFGWQGVLLGMAMGILVTAISVYSLVKCRMKGALPDALKKSFTGVELQSRVDDHA